MNETNRGVIILLAGIWIVLMAMVIFVAWADPREAVERLGDFVQYLDEHRDSPSRLILTLGALVLIVLALLVIIVEVAPEEQTRELKVEQAGATTIVPGEALRLRLEEALVTLPQVTAAKARVYSRDKGIGASLDLTVTPDTNVAAVTTIPARTNAVPGELQYATLVVTNAANWRLTGNLEVGDINIYSGCSLDLNFRTVTVHSAEHALGGGTTNNPGAILWIPRVEGSVYWWE